MQIKTSKFFLILFILFAGFSLPFSGQAQQLPFELIWERGTIYLTSGDSISGPITLSIPSDIVSVRQPNGPVSAFATVNVSGFKVNQERNVGNFRDKYGPLEFERRYQTYMWNHNKDYSNFLSPAFFVVVQPGAYTLLMRETKVMVPVSRGAYYSQVPMRSERILQHFYLAKPNNEVVALRNPKKDLPTIFPSLKDKVAKFAKSNKLDYDEPLELARIIEYCNRSL